MRRTMVCAGSGLALVHVRGPVCRHAHAGIRPGFELDAQGEVGLREPEDERLYRDLVAPVEYYLLAAAGSGGRAGWDFFTHSILSMSNPQKPMHAKPGLYAFFFEGLKAIARSYGYNLVLHGSMNRDLDLIAIPWVLGCQGSHERMIREFCDCIGHASIMVLPEKDCPLYNVTAHGRMQYVININRECEQKGDDWLDPQYYIDISVIPTL